MLTVDEENMLNDIESQILRSLVKIKPEKKFQHLLKRCSKAELRNLYSLPFVGMIAKKILLDFANRFIHRPFNKIKERIFDDRGKVNSLIDVELVRRLKNYWQGWKWFLYFFYFRATTSNEFFEASFIFNNKQIASNNNPTSWIQIADFVVA